MGPVKDQEVAESTPTRSYLEKKFYSVLRMFIVQRPSSRFAFNHIFDKNSKSLQSQPANIWRNNVKKFWIETSPIFEHLFESCFA